MLFVTSFVTKDTRLVAFRIYHDGGIGINQIYLLYCELASSIKYTRSHCKHSPTQVSRNVAASTVTVCFIALL